MSVVAAEYRVRMVSGTGANTHFQVALSCGDTGNLTARLYHQHSPEGNLIQYKLYPDASPYEDYGPMTLGGWELLRLEFNDVTHYRRILVGGNLADESEDLAFVLSEDSLMQFNSAAALITVGPFVWQNELDYARLLVNEIEVYRDDFDSGGLANWPIYTNTGGWQDTETAGVYRATYLAFSGDGTLGRNQWRTSPLGGKFNEMKKHPQTKARLHIYNDGTGNINVQWFEPGSTLPDSAYTLLTGQGGLSPAFEWLDDGRVQLILSNGTTKRESATPWLLASWTNWTA